MDREICLHAWIDGDFRTMQSIIGDIRFGTMERLWNLVDRDRYEDWGRVAAKEREQEAKS
jgi:hypothetical protein